MVDVVTSGRTAARGLARWLTRIAPARARGAVTIAIVPDSRVRLLNRRYRRKDRATDVLSFPAFAPTALPPSRLRYGGTGRRGRPAEPRYLGDIVIASGVARAQARHARHSLQTELRVLALHGLLHLLGYDHDHDGGRMARVESRLRIRGGLREGLIERHT